MIRFKQIFPTWKEFKQFALDYQFYYKDATDVYTDQKILVYYTILYRNFAQSHLAFDHELFCEQLSITLSENFREFFIIRDLMDLVSNKKTEDLIIGLETINNIAESPNIETDKNSVVDYIGTQSRSKSKENIVDRVYALIPKIHIPEIRNELAKYDYLFLKIIPRTEWYFPEEDE